jgi:MerR family transcriptional regulator, copper efflux regulator
VKSLPIACTLDEAGFREREAQLAELGRSLIAVRAEGAEARLTFRVDRRRALEDFIAAESSCCPFLEFRLVDRDERAELTIAGPPDAQPVLGELVAGFVARRS